MGSVTGQLLSLPSGGGAVQGLGEKFAPDLHTGTANFTVPLALPPGRNGFGPQLSLQYSSGAGQGPFGLGFALSVPSIARKTSKGLPRYDDARDTFLLTGNEDLVAVGRPDAARTVFRPRTEGLFARITHFNRAGDDLWEVRTKDGLIHTYAERQSNPGDANAIFAWKLSRTVDTYGNRIEYSYLSDKNQLYLSQIRYIDFGDPAAPQYLVSVRFSYSPRPDVLHDGRAGFSISTALRCARIEVITHAGADRLWKGYRFTYADEDAGAPQALNRASLLRSVAAYSDDGASHEEMPPLLLGYSTFALEKRALVQVAGDLPPWSLAHTDADLVDVRGAGLPDIVELGPQIARVWRNLGGGRFAPPRLLREAPAGLALSDPRVQLLDADGDGRLDVMVSGPEWSGYFPMSFDGGWPRSSFRRYPQAPPFSLKDPAVRLLDLDGDGVTDALRSGTRFECFFNDPERGWHETAAVARGPAESFPDVDFVDPRVFIADMTGDGLQDLALVERRSLSYWPSLGRGRFAPRVRLAIPGGLPEGFDHRRVLLGDVDGDGAADLVYVEDGRVLLWINCCGTGLTGPLEVTGTPRASDATALRLVDLLGSGVRGVLYTNDAGVTPEKRYRFLDFTGGKKPYLLDEIDNRMGAVTRVTYSSSIRYRAEDDRSAATQWKTPLPCAVQVVASVETRDVFSRSKLTSEYRYRHGYWDGVEREFRGFGRVDHRDSESFDKSGLDPEHYTPPIETRTWFHQGALGDGRSADYQPTDFHAEYWPDDGAMLPALQPLTPAQLSRKDFRDALRAQSGSVLRTEVYSLDGSERQARPFTVTEALHEAALVAAPENERPVFHARPRASRTTQWERGSEPLTRIELVDDYDDYGQPRARTNLALPRSASDAILATRDETAFAARDDGAGYLVDRVASLASWELIAAKGRDAASLLRDVRSGVASKRIIANTIHHYDGAAFIGLDAGALGGHGAPVRTERLAFTDELLAALQDAPPGLRDPTQGWPAQYPPSFIAKVPASLGYQRAGAGACAGLYAQEERRGYDWQLGQGGRGVVKASRDAMGAGTTVLHDGYELFPISATDPVGLTTTTEADLRALQLVATTTPNGTRTAQSLTPLGLIASVRVHDAAGAGGDPQDRPGVVHSYDLSAFHLRGSPVSVRTIVRPHSPDEDGVTADELAQELCQVRYADGFGRVLQTRSQAESVSFGAMPFGDSGLTADQSAPIGPAIGAAPAAGAQRVRVSGWQRYDNKGRAIAKCEPFFDTGWDYDPAPPAGSATVSLRYDPAGRLVRTLHPDGSQRLTVYGGLADLANPDSYSPNPWESHAYDENDNAGRYQPAVTAVSAHWNTPASATVDALGRVVRCRQRPTTSEADALDTFSEWDLRGNLLRAVDPLGRAALSMDYDLLGRPLRVERLDGGAAFRWHDAAGREVVRTDARGATILDGIDAAGRLSRRWARDSSSATFTLRQWHVYGDDGAASLDPAAARAAGLLGRLYKQYDEAGLLTLRRYDLRGNLIDKERRCLQDAVLAAPMQSGSVAFVADWESEAIADLEANWLDAIGFATATAFDSCKRVRSILYPQAVDGKRRQLQLSYGEGGALRAAALDGISYLRDAQYNARGQRILVCYGNGVMTRWAFDERTFRVVRQRSERFTTNGSTTYQPGGAPLQDAALEYDPVGNLLAQHERFPGCGVPVAPDALDRLFAHDALYRLTSATGRESAALPGSPWDTAPRSQDVQAARQYSERYVYDGAGNLVSLRHASDSGEWVRNLPAVSTGNRLASFDQSGASFAIEYDAAGNLVRETTSRRFHWDAFGRLSLFGVQADGAQPTLLAQYRYDAEGNRIQKVMVKPGGSIESRRYIGGLFERTSDASGQCDEIWIAESTARVRVGQPLDGDRTPDVVFRLRDHLGSVTLTIDGGGAWISREEHTPYGETSFGGTALQRYRFTGKERDDESGLYYQGARYYGPWQARWISPDPRLSATSASPYCYVDGRPLVAVDPDGHFFWLVILLVGAGAAAFSTPGEANAPTSANTKLLPAPTNAEVLASVTVNVVGGEIGGAVGGKVLKATGSKLLGGMAGGASAGGILGPANLATHDIARGQASSAGDYLRATAIGAGTGLALGAAAGAASRVIGGKAPAPGGKVTLYHGTNEAGMKGIQATGPRVGGTVEDDFGRGFYLSTQRGVAESGAEYAVGKHGGEPVVGRARVAVEDLGSIVDIRPGGAHEAAWNQFLKQEAVPGGATWQDILNLGSANRGSVFETFLQQSGLKADTVLGPLMPGKVSGGTEQVTIRSADVASKLKFTWSGQ